MTRRRYDDDERMRIIEAAAKTVFLDKGFEAASMEEVAARAGVSKATLYAHFRGKSALFERVIENTCASLFPDPPPEPAAEEARAGLMRLGHYLMDRMVSDDFLAVTRSALCVGRHWPQLAQALYLHSVVAARMVAANRLRRLGLADDDAEQAATTFLCLLCGDFFLRRLIGVGDAAVQRTAVEQAVDQFLRMQPSVGGAGLGPAVPAV